MNLKECRQHIATKYGFNNWNETEGHPPFMWDGKLIVESDISNELLKLYASEKVKEALELVAEKVTYRESRSGQHSTTILSLETELIENIKNEK